MDTLNGAATRKKEKIEQEAGAFVSP